jgi:hypothetical protein
MFCDQVKIRMPKDFIPQTHSSRGVDKTRGESTLLTCPRRVFLPNTSSESFYGSLLLYSASARSSLVVALH